MAKVKLVVQSFFFYVNKPHEKTQTNNEPAAKSCISGAAHSYLYDHGSFLLT